MIVVTRLNDSQFAINPDLIERIHENPDTTLVMVDGAKYIVTESMAEVIDLVAQYRSRIVSLAYDERPAMQSALQPALQPASRAAPAVREHERPLGLVTEFASAAAKNGEAR